MKWLLKKFFKRESFVYQTLKAYKRFGLLKPTFTKCVEDILSAYSRLKNGKVTFVQIGSNDGMSGDPLHPFITGNEWTGVLVEPMPLLFDQLKKNYAPWKERLVFVNTAISEQKGQASIFYVSNEDGSLPEWVGQLSSFSREVISKHADYFPGINERIREFPLPTIRFDDLLRDNGIGVPDLVHTDTEGHDYEILKTIDLGKIRPDIFLYEQKHIPVPDVRRSVKRFRKAGYRVLLCKSDCIAIKRSLDLRF